MIQKQVLLNCYLLVRQMLIDIQQLFYRQHQLQMFNKLIVKFKHPTLHAVTMQLFKVIIMKPVLSELLLSYMSKTKNHQCHVIAENHYNIDNYYSRSVMNKHIVDGILIQGVALTGRNTTGPPWSVGC